MHNNIINTPRGIIKMNKLKLKPLKTVLTSLMLFIIAVIIIIGTQNKSEPVIISKSSLQEAIAIEELSTADFVYNGIAETNKEGILFESTYYISYDSTVKVGVNFQDITFEIDHDNKGINVLLPKITVNVASIDTSSINFIPKNPDITLQNIYELCKEDAINEANQSKKLKATAEDNVKIVVETLLSPLLDKTEYTLAWGAN